MTTAHFLACLSFGQTIREPEVGHQHLLLPPYFSPIPFFTSPLLFLLSNPFLSSILSPAPEKEGEKLARITHPSMISAPLLGPLHWLCGICWGKMLLSCTISRCPKMPSSKLREANENTRRSLLDQAHLVIRT